MNKIPANNSYFTNDSTLFYQKTPTNLKNKFLKSFYHEIDRIKIRIKDLIGQSSRHSPKFPGESLIDYLDRHQAIKADILIYLSPKYPEDKTKSEPSLHSLMLRLSELNSQYSDEDFSKELDYLYRFCAHLKNKIGFIPLFYLQKTVSGCHGDRCIDNTAQKDYYFNYEDPYHIYENPYFLSQDVLDIIAEHLVYQNTQILHYQTLIKYGYLVSYQNQFELYLFDLLMNRLDQVIDQMNCDKPDVFLFFIKNILTIMLNMKHKKSWPSKYFTSFDKELSEKSKTSVYKSMIQLLMFLNTTCLSRTESQVEKLPQLSETIKDRFACAKLFDEEIFELIGQILPQISYDARDEICGKERREALRIAPDSKDTPLSPPSFLPPIKQPGYQSTDCNDSDCSSLTQPSELDEESDEEIPVGFFPDIAPAAQQESARFKSYDKH